MILGPFALVPGQLAIIRHASIEEWEEHIPKLFEMQRYVPWWIGDAVVYGEARFGDVFWQAMPPDVSEKMIERLAGVSKKIPPDERLASLSWTHHLTSLRIDSPVLRRSLLKKAESDCMDSEAFSKLVGRVK